MRSFFKKALSFMRHTTSPLSLINSLKSGNQNYRRKVGDLINASVVMAPVQWIQRAIPEARFRTMVRTKDGTEEIVDHPLTKLMARPNPHFTFSHLMGATVLSRVFSGNAYWLKVRNGAGQVAELWWVPHWSIEPKWPVDGSEFISHYLYKPGNGPDVILAVEDVIHFRDGVDPHNPRLGLSCLCGVFPEIYTDMEASNFVAALLDNMAVPGLVISPDGSAAPSEADVSSVKDWVRSAFGGSNRGQPLVMQGSTKVQQYGFSPQQMDLSPTRNVSEERVCAAIGIPAAIVGFGAGLQATQVGATMTELRKLAWTNGLLPMLYDIKDEINRSLVPEMTQPEMANGSMIEAGFDVSEVKALQDDLNTEATRWDTMIRGGWASVADGRDGMGLDVDDSHQIYLRPFSMIEVPVGSAPRLPESETDEDPQKTSPLLDSGIKNRRASPNRAQRRFVSALVRQEQPLANTMQKRLEAFFNNLGRDAARAVRDDPLIDFGKSRGSAENKTDDVLVDRILETLGFTALKIAYKQIYERHYIAVAQEIAEAGELVGLATNLPDPVAQNILQAGGKRAELVDIERQSRKAIFTGLAEGRAEGEGVTQLAARIRDSVKAGPWASAQTRSIVIARTETKFAQNQSTIEIGRHSGVDQMMIFDGRLGPDRSDPDHIDRDGSIVSVDEATQLAADEHPNGTLSFAPHFE